MIPFLSLKDVNNSFEPELSEKVISVVKSGWYLLGQEVAEFESRFSEYCGVKNTIGVANGLDALILILRAYMEMGKLRVGDEVLVPSNTYIATILAISSNGLVPIFVEPRRDTMNVDPGQVKRRLSSKTRAILAVHLYGQLAAMDELAVLAKHHGLLLLEDSAQAHGAQLGIRRAGALGDASGFSFYPGKNLGCLGDGGAVTTDDDALAEVVRSLANYGSRVKYHNEFKGVNSRLDELQAAVLSLKLKRLDTDTERRRQIAEHYQAKIRNPVVELPVHPAERAAHVWHLYVIRSSARDRLQKHLSDQGIQTLIHYPIPPHRQKAYSEMGKESYPISEEIHAQVLSLPMSPTLIDSDVDAVIDGVNSFV